MQHYTVSKNHLWPEMLWLIGRSGRKFISGPEPLCFLSETLRNMERSDRSFLNRRQIRLIWQVILATQKHTRFRSCMLHKRSCQQWKTPEKKRRRAETSTEPQQHSRAVSRSYPAQLSLGCWSRCSCPGSEKPGAATCLF